MNRSINVLRKVRNRIFQMNINYEGVRRQNPSSFAARPRAASHSLARIILQGRQAGRQHPHTDQVTAPSYRETISCNSIYEFAAPSSQRSFSPSQRVDCWLYVTTEAAHICLRLYSNVTLAYSGPPRLRSPQTQIQIAYDMSPQSIT